MRRLAARLAKLTTEADTQLLRTRAVPQAGMLAAGMDLKASMQLKAARSGRG